METTTCPHCQQPHLAGTRFCPNTGKAIPIPVTPLPNSIIVQEGNTKIEAPLTRIPTHRLYDMLVGAIVITLLGMFVVIPIGIWIVFWGKPFIPGNIFVPSVTATLQTSESLMKSTADVSTEAVLIVTPTLSAPNTPTLLPTDTRQPTATTFVNYPASLPSPTPIYNSVPSLTPTPSLGLTPGKGRLLMINNMTINIRIILNTNTLTYDVERGKTRVEYPPLGTHGWQIIAGTCRLTPSAIRIDPTATVTVFAPSAGKCDFSLNP